jgi:hypothetical protein
MKCHDCGRRISPRSKFCPYCGKPVTPRRNPSRAAEAQPRWPIYLALVVAGIAIGALSLRWLQKPETGAAVTATAADFDPTLRGEQLARLYPEVYEVASHFNCPCGSCDDGVEVCDCEMERGGAEVRLFIYQLLQAHKPPHVIELVAEKYGHRKSGVPSSLELEKLPPAASWQDSLK